MRSDGDFLPRAKPWHKRVHYLYANAYFVLGGVAASRYQIVAPAVDFILSQQNPLHGGFYSQRTAPGEQAQCDTMSAGAAGVACLASGHVDAARRTADFIRLLVDLQPDPERRFFTTLEADGRLLIDVEEDEAFARIVDTRLPDQCWYAVGLPFAFLVLLTEATGDAQYRELAQWLFNFQVRCVNPWEGGSSGKAGWGCSMLYRITGEERYREIALQVARFILSLQDADGGWATYRDPDEGLTNTAMDVSAEFTLWCALIAANILAGDTS
jgi:hypothetical protein